jgi:hypothetical protein
MAIAEHTDHTVERVEAFLSHPGKLLIDGEWVEAASGATFETINPATEKRLAEAAHGEKEDIDRAVRAARKAFAYESEWRRMSPSARGKLIWRIGDLIEQHAEELAMLESLDNGKPMGVARVADVPLVGRPLPLHGRLADEDPRRHDADLGGRRVSVLHAARAGRRGRPDHPLELPAADGGLEARSRAGMRLHGGAEARRADPAVGAVSGRAAAGGGAPRGRGQHRDRVRRRRGGAVGSRRRRQGRVHRLDRGRQADRRRGCGQPQEGVARARRQVAQRRLRRRRPRRRDRRCRQRHLLQPRSVLQRRLAPVHPESRRSTRLSRAWPSRRSRSRSGPVSSPARRWAR